MYEQRLRTTLEWVLLFGASVFRWCPPKIQQVSSQPQLGDCSRSALAAQQRKDQSKDAPKTGLRNSNREQAIRAKEKERHATQYIARVRVGRTVYYM